jgi:hypothetical protein
MLAGVVLIRTRKANLAVSLTALVSVHSHSTVHAVGRRALPQKVDRLAYWTMSARVRSDGILKISFWTLPAVFDRVVMLRRIGAFHSTAVFQETTRGTIRT